MHQPSSLVAARPAITIIGSDRIHSPLRMIAPRSSTHIRTSGFAIGEQSSRLALARLKRLIEREGRFSVGETDLVFIEISCSTVLSFKGEPVGTDWLSTHFPSLMAQPVLAKQIWRISALRSEAERLEALGKFSSLGKVLTSEGKAKLAKLALERTTPEEMTTQLAEMQTLAKNLVIATPCPALKSNGKPLHYRDRLIRDLTTILKGLEIRQFDPGPLIERFGQSLAFEPGEQGLHSYTDGFVRMIASHLGSHYLAAIATPVTQPAVTQPAADRKQSRAAGR